MLERMKDIPTGVDGLRASGTVTAPEERRPMPHRLISGTGVLVLEPQGPLCESDALAWAESAEVPPPRKSTEAITAS
jgi:hypothetical protein